MLIPGKMGGGKVVKKVYPGMNAPAPAQNQHRVRIKLAGITWRDILSDLNSLLGTNNMEYAVTI